MHVQSIWRRTIDESCLCNVKHISEKLEQLNSAVQAIVHRSAARS